MGGIGFLTYHLIHKSPHSYVLIYKVRFSNSYTTKISKIPIHIKCSSIGCANNPILLIPITIIITNLKIIT